MPATKLDAPSASLLGCPRSTLALRIRGTDRHGQVVRLESSKVLVGSSRHCTLRLRAGGIAPWHCLILRGSEHTVVRRFHADTRLNDAAFTDAPLHAGDRLAIGPIQLDVVEEGPTNADFPSVTAPVELASAAQREQVTQVPDSSVFENQIRRLEKRLRLANRQSRARLRAVIRGLRAIQAENAALQTQIESRAAGEFAAQQASASARAELESAQNSFAERERRLARSIAEFEQTKSDSDDAKKTTDRTALENANRQWAVERQSWDNAKLAWETERTTWEQQRASLQLQARSAASNRDALEQEHIVRRTQLDQQQTNLDRLAAALADRQQAMETAAKALEAEKLEFVAKRSKLQYEIEQKNAELDRLKSELDADQDHRRTEAELLVSQQSQRDEILNRRAAELEVEAQELAQAREEFEAEKARFQRETSATTSARNQALEAAPVDVVDEELSQADAPAAEDDENATQPYVQPKTSTDSDDDVFARLRALSLLKSEVSSAAATQRPKAEEKPATSSASGDEPRNLAAPAPAAAPEEESIDDYMSRLLQRMRGDSGEVPSRNPRSATGAIERTPPSPMPREGDPAAEAEQSSGDPGAKKNAALQPRKAAPEKSHNLAAMREIANLTARSAIATHQLRRGSNRAWKNLACAVVSMACGVWLLTTTEEMDSPYFFGGLAALVISLFWLVKSGVLARSAKRFKLRHAEHLAAASLSMQANDDASQDEPQASEVQS